MTQASQGPFLSCIKIRYIQVLLCALLEGVLIGSRVLITIAIVAMTTSTSSNPNIPVYTWINNSIILSSFYWSNAVVPFFAGWIIQRRGPKWFLFAAVLVDSLVNCMTPALADKFGSNGLIFCRVLQGIAQGIAGPSLSFLLGRWVPTHERTWLVSMYSLGGYLGAIAAKFLTGFVAASWLGWPAMFYAFGATGIAFAVLNLWIGSDTPALHSYISDEERFYIQQSLGQAYTKKELRSIPWRAIFTSLPYWAVIVGTIGAAWGVTLLQTELPTYFSKVVQLDITKNGVFSTAPYFVAAILQALFGPLIDFIINRGYTSRATARRIFHGSGCFLCAASLGVITFLPNNVVYVEILFIICYVGKSILQQSINALDISPKFAGILLGFASVISQCIGLFAPICVHFVVYDQTDATLWRIVFVSTSVLYVITGILFLVFMSSDRQWWNNIKKEEEESSNETEKYEKIVKLKI